MANSLMDWIDGLLRDPDAREAFMHDPNRYAEEHGFHNLSRADVHDALSLIADADHSHFNQGVHYPAPRHWDQDGDPDGAHNGAQYLRGYLDDHQEIIERHEDIDNSVRQDVDTGGGRDLHHQDVNRADLNRADYLDDHSGNFNQFIDNDPVVASGNGAVAAGGNIDHSAVTPGDGNVIGTSNYVDARDDNTTAFGSGDSTRADLDRTDIDDGGSFSVRGDSIGFREDNDTSTDVRNSGDGDTAVNTSGDHGYADQNLDQSEDDDSSHVRYEDNAERESHDDFNSHNDSRYDGSHDVDVHH